jgi:hypothetical protein
MGKELVISVTENVQFCEWLEGLGYALRHAKLAPVGTGRASEPTSVELNELWKRFDREQG